MAPLPNTTALGCGLFPCCAVQRGRNWELSPCVGLADLGIIMKGGKTMQRKRGREGAEGNGKGRR